MRPSRSCSRTISSTSPTSSTTKYHILGKGNGIPDILDEAMWGTMFWEYMQETNGAIHWGTETKGYSPFTTYENDQTRFGTEVLRCALGQFRRGDVHAHGPHDQALQRRPAPKSCRSTPRWRLRPPATRDPADAQALLRRAEVPADRR